jgi:CheY-like chemotaxis protein
MGGKIGLESQPGQGTVFRFSVPLRRVTAEQPMPASAVNTLAIKEQAARPQLAHVLVAEDNQVNQQVARLMLEQLGCQVKIVEDGATAVAALEAQHYDLVFMDCQMPVMDGYEATLEIRRREHTSQRPRTPIIALTANVLIDNVRRCQEVGMDEYLSKPISKQDLADKIQRWAS